MNQEMFNALNQQVTHEFYNSSVYLTISNFYYQQKLNGLGKHFKCQSCEEIEHGQKIIDYLLKFEIDQQIKLPMLTPTQEWSNLFMPLDAALMLEKTTTVQINELMEKAMLFEDYATQDFLQWYINEQVTEEYEANYRIAQAKIGGSYDNLALYIYNNLLLEDK